MRARPRHRRPGSRRRNRRNPSPEAGARTSPRRFARQRRSGASRRKGSTEMQPFTVLTGVAAPLKIVNVDTDMIIPKQYLKTIKRTGLGTGLFAEMRYQRGRLGEPGLRPQQAGLPQGADPGRRRQFRLRLVARACPLGAARFRHPLRHLDQLRRHLLQQLLQERHPADQGQPEDLEKLIDDAERGANATLSIDLENAGNPRPRRRHGQVRHRRRSASTACSTASTTSA